MKIIKAALKRIIPARLIEVLLVPFVYISGKILLFTRRRISRMPFIRKMLFSMGVFPIQDHYYEPMFNPKHLRHSLRDDHSLPGIDFNDDAQLALLNSFQYNDELLSFPVEKPEGDSHEYYYNNGAYESGDGEILYNMVRKFKPSHIIEVGSGSSTLMILNALRKNKEEDDAYTCLQECIEPYEQSWLETKPVSVIRSRLEDVNLDKFMTLGENDMLIIDSSHIIRPQGDVVTEYLEILPSLASGVIVHIHDIFTPKDYPDSWVYDDVRLWNEQYLLEAFMTFNGKFEVLAALNYLTHHHYDKLTEKCPIMKQQPGREPGAFWIRRM